MTEWLVQPRPVDAVQAAASADAPYVLDATFLELYGDFRNGRAPEAVVTVQFTIRDASSPSRAVVFDEIISRRIAIDRAGAPQLVRGYNVALTELLAQLTSDLSEATSLDGDRSPSRGPRTAQRRPPPS
jgi:hypothetical protein